MPETKQTPVFSRYELLGELGEGAFGQVYKARHKVMKRLVALKVLPPALRKDAETRKRFEREAEALARLHHPHVVQIHDADIEQSFPYLAMEFVEGRDLRKVLQERTQLSVDEVIQLGLEMAQALDHVHSQGIVHRDMKPSNIMLGPDGHATLTDFGIAFAATLPRITQGFLGTPEYMSPEQVEGTTLDGRSDLYSLGVLLYECLTGTAPFRAAGESMTETYALLKRIQEDPAPPIHRADVPPWLADVVARCLAKKPEDRFQDGAALADALNNPPVAHQDSAAPQEQPVSEQPPASPANEDLLPDKNHLLDPSPAPESTPKRAKTRWIAGLVVLLLALLGGAYGFGWLGTTDDNALTPEERAALQNIDPTASLAGAVIQSGFSLVVASFSQRPLASAEAERFRQRFSGQAIPVDVLLGKSSSHILHRVAIGQTATLDEADALRDRLAGSLPDSVWITRIVSPSIDPVAAVDSLGSDGPPDLPQPPQTAEDSLRISANGDESEDEHEDALSIDTVAAADTAGSDELPPRSQPPQPTLDKTVEDTPPTRPAPENTAPLTADERRNLPRALREALRDPMAVDTLYLGANQLTTVPESVARLTNLRGLNLQANRLTTVPESITRLKNLRGLNLRANRLTTVPEPVTRLTNLEWLNLRANRLTTVPESITRLTNLTGLDLSMNQLATVPESITRLKKLEILYLSGNQLDEIPASITRLNNLKWLFVPRNQLTTLPESMTRLSNLERLSLVKNPISEAERARIRRLLPNTTIYF